MSRRPGLPRLPRLVVLISGRGRNLDALLGAIADRRLPVEATLVVASRADAPGLAHARRHGVPVAVVAGKDFPLGDRAAYDARLADVIDAAQPDIVALAGFMRILSAPFVLGYEGRMLNIHPSLLPAYKGLHTHARALADDAARHGASVHFVTLGLDEGPVIVQDGFKPSPEDTPESLARRVMEAVEVHLYWRAIAALADGRLVWNDGVPLYRGTPLDPAQPLGPAAFDLA